MSNENFNDDVGLRMIGFVDEEFVIELDIQARHLNAVGIVHGGVLCTILDTAMARAFIDTLPKERQVGATLEMKINFLKASRSGTLTAYGRLVNATRRTAFVEGVIKNSDDHMVAKSSGTIILPAAVAD